MTTPLELTQQLRDISVTERGQFRSCRRRWWFNVIENLQPKLSDDMALVFGTGIHRALEAFYKTRGSLAKRQAAALAAFHAWGQEQRKLAPDNDAFTAVLEHEQLGEAMLNGYFEYDRLAPVKLGKVVAVEGNVTAPSLVKPKPPAGYPPEARVIRHESGRLLVPIVDPDTKRPIRDPDTGELIFLTMRMDLISQRATPKTGLWITDSKTAGSAPSDHGIDFDDQVTGYCYGAWRWLAQIPRGVVYNSLIKQAPKEPRLVNPQKKEHRKFANAEGLVLSTAKDQLTTPNMYREALIKHGIQVRGRILSEDHAACLGALLTRGWDPFFRRYEVTRNEHELASFERHLVNEYDDMLAAWRDPARRYPNRSTWWCSRCPVNKICLAIEDGSDVDYVIDNQYVVGPDRKAAA